MKIKQKQILVLLTLAALSFGCKKPIEDSISSAKNNSNQLSTNAIGEVPVDYLPTDFVLKSDLLRERFNNESSVSGDTYSLDSGVIYLQAALNIQLGDGNVFEVEHERLNQQIAFDYTGSISEQSLKDRFSEIKTIANQFLESVSYSDKAIKFIITELITDESTSDQYLNLTVVVGRRDYNPVWIEGDLGKTDYEYFPTTWSFRYNYNGGECSSQPYFAPLDAGGFASRAGRFQDIHGDWHGFDNGGAKELEKAINSSYVASTIRLANGDSRITCPTGYKMVYLVFKTHKMVLPEDVINPSNNINTKHNPTDIFSYNDWSTTLHSSLPCINGAQMNHYLGKAIPIITNNLPNMLPGYTFADCHVYSLYKRYDGIVSPTPLEAVRIRTFNVDGINRDEYFSHRYNLISTTPTVVVDPATQ
ncbi:MAG: hypothetical protein KBE91_05915 [Bacteroidia bacterium]|nr:hypothetical protein [Bacteroidia bacterium]MBP9689129.1 hypothetical protein [Bacteroidia bacterium]